MNRQQKRAYHASKRAKWSEAKKVAWKEDWKGKAASWNRKRDQAGAPAPVFADKKKRAMAKMNKFLGIEPEPEMEIPIEPPRPKRRKRRNEAQLLEDSYVYH